MHSWSLQGGHKKTPSTPITYLWGRGAPEVGPKLCAGRHMPAAGGEHVRLDQGGRWSSGKHHTSCLCSPWQGGMAEGQSLLSKQRAGKGRAGHRKAVQSWPPEDRCRPPAVSARSAIARNFCRPALVRACTSGSLSRRNLHWGARTSGLLLLQAPAHGDASA